MTARLVRLAEQFPAVLLTGARQSGKTTLLRAAFPEHRYVSLDLPSDAEAAERSPAAWLAAHPPPLLVDEVQYAPALFRHLKTVIDADRHAMGRIVLTGSQKFTLMPSVGDSLAGRCAWVELENLCASEIQVAAAPLANDMVHLMARGQFPELWRDPQIDAAEFYRAYLATYIERDVRQLLNVARLRDFERFMRLCAAYSGQTFKKSEVARVIGISVDTVTQWLGVLEASNQVVLIEPYAANVGKRLAKMPKLYVCDTGLACYLLGVDAATLAGHQAVGALWETFVCAELRKYMQQEAGAAQLCFYRDQVGREVDFVLLRGGRAVLVECKWTELPEPRAAAAMATVATTLAGARPVAVGLEAAYVAARPHSDHPVGDTGAWAVHGARLAARLRGPIAGGG